eukprot:CAMPEP_0113447672 /NCGR_PEP_ID=MMETSP0014_2-20120614/4360_1 /TAXON_ID=2857 /ORGANISM="Nitzschia sp." /LENGTH=939 /DNA_ID=CAMNT_0000338837 /DNA_START=485 /DNA_END=3301 /DNA_ORIENTATION=+ /assembly_acc=CAM_ASM_000159
MSGSTQSLDDSGNTAPDGTATNNNNNNHNNGDDAVLWSDNPELDYFRMMMNERLVMAEYEGSESGSGSRSGSDGPQQRYIMSTNDSLIGDSTMASILEGNHLRQDGRDTTTNDDTDGDGTYDYDQPSFTLQDHNRLVDGGDTVDNVTVEEAGSIVSWFRKKRSQRLGRHGSSTIDTSSHLGQSQDGGDGTTLESPSQTAEDNNNNNNTDIVPAHTPAMSARSKLRTPTSGKRWGRTAQKQEEQQEAWNNNENLAGIETNNEWVNFTTPVKPQTLSSAPSQRHLGLTNSLKKKKTKQFQEKQQQQQQQQQSRQSRPSPPRQNNIVVDHEVESGMKISREIPGFIIVTNGHSSAVQTRKSPQSIPMGSSADGAGGEAGIFGRSHPHDDSDDGQNVHGGEKRWGNCVWGRMVIVFLLFLVVVSSVTLAIVVMQKKNDTGAGTASQNTDAESSFQSNGDLFPSADPFPPLPTITTAPTLSPTSSFETSPQPSAMFTSTNSPTADTGGVLAPTDSPSLSTNEPSASPSINILDSLAERLSPLSPESVSAWSNPNAPQSRAIDWLADDVQSFSFTYSDRQLLQRFALATLYYSTNGIEWNTGNGGSASWLNKSTNECQWSGVECKTSSNVRTIRVIRLVRRNLTGQLPPEIGLLSDTLEEIYLNNNNIDGTLPLSMFRLSNLRRLQLPSNRLVGNIPSQFGDLQALEVVSLKNNAFTGTIPTFGMLSSLASIDLGKNDLVGTIPEDAFSGMGNIGSIYLAGNSITGTIPESMGSLSSLEVLDTKGNDFVGSMPNSLCFVDELIADCGGLFICDCCTECCIDGARCFFNTPPPTGSPTAPPVATVAPNPFVTPAPTFVSTLAPTQLPTESAAAPAASPVFSPVATTAQDEPDISCVASIFTDRTCYENGNDIVVTFTNCDETQTDWIGVWQSNESPDNLSGDPLAW